MIIFIKLYYIILCAVEKLIFAKSSEIALHELKFPVMRALELSEERGYVYVYVMYMYMYIAMYILKNYKVGSHYGKDLRMVNHWLKSIYILYKHI